MALEILSIAVVNYFTSSPEIFRPSQVQMQQVKQLLGQVHTNFLTVVEFVISRLPTEALQNPLAGKLSVLIKNRKKKKSAKDSQGAA